MSRAPQAEGKRKPLVCPVCHMTFLDQVTLNEHKKKDHNLDPRTAGWSWVAKRIEQSNHY